jgi:CHAT domain-containing protein
LQFRDQVNNRTWEPWLRWNAAIAHALKGLNELGIGTLHRWLRDTAKVAVDGEIVVSPPGWLSVLPFAAAGELESGHCLLDDYAVRLIPNAGLLPRCTAAAARIEQRPASLLAVTDPREDLLKPHERISPAASAFAGLPQEVLSGRDATRERVMQQLPQHSHYVQYGHAGWTGGGNVVYLANNDEVSDGEIRQLHLAELRLAVLAACETGLIDLNQADEFIGLVDSFLQGGCAGVIASLWPVAADATYRLVSDALALHLRRQEDTRLSPAQALRQAQRTLRDTATPIAIGPTQQAGRPQGAAGPRTSIADGSSAMPVFWAAFICAGA